MSGKNITLKCEADGYPPPFVTWRKNLQQISVNSRYSFSSENGFGSLVIKNVQVLDAGNYSCVIVSNLYGSIVVEPSVKVDVIDGECIIWRLHG